MADVNYSQNNEQEVILNFFGDYKGRFLDIGAYDGKTLSNTYALSLLGWNGICVEPSPQNFINLSKLYEENDNILCANCAIGNTNGMLKFYDTPGDFYGSLTPGNGTRYGKTEHPIEVQVITTNELLKRVGTDINFISLDVEGNNFEVLKDIPFDKLTELKLICVETDGLFTEMADYMEQYGFIEIHRTGENIILGRK